MTRENLKKIVKTYAKDAKKLHIYTRSSEQYYDTVKIEDIDYKDQELFSFKTRSESNCEWCNESVFNHYVPYEDVVMIEFECVEE